MHVFIHVYTVCVCLFSCRTRFVVTMDGLDEKYGGRVEERGEREGEGEGEREEEGERAEEGEGEREEEEYTTQGGGGGGGAKEGTVYVYMCTTHHPSSQGSHCVFHVRIVLVWCIGSGFSFFSSYTTDLVSVLYTYMYQYFHNVQVYMYNICTSSRSWDAREVQILAQL